MGIASGGCLPGEEVTMNILRASAVLVGTFSLGLAVLTSPIAADTSGLSSAGPLSVCSRC